MSNDDYDALEFLEFDDIVKMGKEEKANEDEDEDRKKKKLSKNPRSKSQVGGHGKSKFNPRPAHSRTHMPTDLRRKNPQAAGQKGLPARSFNKAGSQSNHIQTSLSLNVTVVPHPASTRPAQPPPPTSSIYLPEVHGPGFLYHCNDKTIVECLERGIFASSNKNCNKIYKNVKPGSPLFLFNYNERTLDGPFRATSKCEKNIQPDAFEGRFQWQVSFDFWNHPKELEPVTLEVREVNSLKLVAPKENKNSKQLTLPCNLTVEMTEKVMQLALKNLENFPPSEPNSLNKPPPAQAKPNAKRTDGIKYHIPHDVVWSKNPGKRERALRREYREKAAAAEEAAAAVAAMAEEAKNAKQVKENKKKEKYKHVKKSPQFVSVQQRICYFCRQVGHMGNTCPNR